MTKYISNSNFDYFLSVLKNKLDSRYAKTSHSHPYLPTTGGTINGSLEVNGDLSAKNGYVLPTIEDKRGFLINSYGNGDNSYIEMVLRNSNNNDWDWSNSMKLFANGELNVKHLFAKGSIVLNNNVSLYGRTTSGGQYNICGVDSNNNIYIGWNNENYINVNNAISFYRDVHIQPGSSLYTNSVRINSGGDYSTVSFGSNGVRLEYERGQSVYIAGSETNHNGLGTPFRAKHFEAVDGYMKFGSHYLTISSSMPSGNTGDVWIRV